MGRSKGLLRFIYREKDITMGNRATPGKAKIVTPNDTANNAGGTLYIGGSGDLNVILQDDNTDTAILFTGVAAGDFPRRVKRVLATSTTATNIIVDL